MTGRGAGNTEEPCEQGSITPLLLGVLVIGIVLVLAVVDLTALHLARVRLLDAADAAAAASADRLDIARAYGGASTQGPPIGDSSVRSAAQAHLAGRERPANVRGWALAPGTGSPDGRVAVVRVTGRVELPVVSPVLEAFGGGVDVTVESRARANNR